MELATTILGIMLCLAPFAFDYTGTPAALWTSLVMGASIVILNILQSYKWAAVIGLITFVAPWIFGFSGISAALWECLITGAFVAIVAGFRGFLADEAKTGESQQHHSVRGLKHLVKMQ